MEVIVTKQRNVKDGQPMQQGNMQKEAILNRLRQRGCRITKQRMLLLDIILEEECSSCKEIYYKASKIHWISDGLSHDQYARGDRGNQPSQHVQGFLYRMRGGDG